MSRVRLVGLLALVFGLGFGVCWVVTYQKPRLEASDASRTSQHPTTIEVIRHESYGPPTFAQPLRVLEVTEPDGRPRPVQESAGPWADGTPRQRWTVRECHHDKQRVYECESLSR